MRISARNWATAFAIAVLVHAGIAFGWLFLLTDPKTQAAEEHAVRVSLGKWMHTLTVDSRETATSPEVPVAQEVSPSISTESSVLREVVRDVHVQQIGDTAVDEAVNVQPNEDMLSEEAAPGESTEEPDLADSVLDVAAAVKPASTEELPAIAKPAEPEQASTEQVESARVNTLEKTVPPVNKDQDSLSEEDALEKAADQSVPDHLAKQEESGSGNALPQGEANPAINEETGYALQQEYLKVLMSRLNAQKRYPSAARRRGAAGVAKVRFTILADGSMESSELVESSGNRHLDKEALRMLSRAEPFPPIPKSLQKNQINLQLPIVFELN